MAKEDVFTVSQNEVFYVTRRGKEFNRHYYLNCFDKIKRLGSGGFGTVFLLKHKISGKEIAAKFIELPEGV